VATALAAAAERNNVTVKAPKRVLERERCSKERNEGNRNVIQVREGNESVSRKGNPGMQQ
jgi:hypothetical protein